MPEPRILKIGAGRHAALFLREFLDRSHPSPSSGLLFVRLFHRTEPVGFLYGRAFHVDGNYKNLHWEWLANRWPRFYEEHLAWMAPAWHIRVVLTAVK